MEQLKLKKIDYIKFFQDQSNYKSHPYCWQECNILKSFWKRFWHLLTNFNICLLNKLTIQPKSNEKNLFMQKLFTNINSTFIHNPQTEDNLNFLQWWRDEQTLSHTMKYHSALKMNKLAIHITTRMNYAK